MRPSNRPKPRAQPNEAGVAEAASLLIAPILSLNADLPAHRSVSGSRVKSCLSLILLVLSLGATPLAAQQTHHGFDPKNMDTSVSPCADFFRYAMGTWEKRTAIPAEYSKYGVDQEIEERTFAILKDILEGAAADTSAPNGSERQKVGDFFASGMDVDRIEKEGAGPLEPFLARIGSVGNRKGLAAEIAHLQETGIDAAFGLEVGPDDKNSALNIAQLSQKGKPAGGLLDGFTLEQRLFLTYAETWRVKFRDEALKFRLLTDEHAPPKYRVLGPLSNMPEFSQAFGCKTGDRMVRPPKDRPSIW